VKKRSGLDTLGKGVPGWCGRDGTRGLVGGPASSARFESQLMPVRMQPRPLGRGRVPECVAFHLDHVSVMKQPVERGARQQQVTEQGWPLLDRAIRCEDRRPVLVALPDDLVEVDRLVGDQRPQTKIVKSCAATHNLTI